MPDLESLFPGRFLKGKTLTEPLTIQIVAVEATLLEGETADDKKVKGVVKYKARTGAPGADGKPTIEQSEMVLNKTNALLLAAITGTRDYAKWPKHLATIAYDPTIRFGGETPGGIRVVGSPELKAPVTVEIKFRKKRPQSITLTPTGAAKKAPEPDHDPVTGEAVPS